MGLIRPLPWDELPPNLAWSTHSGLERLIAVIAADLYDTLPLSGESSATPRQQLESRLGRMAAMTVLIRRLEAELMRDVHGAATVEGARTSYSELGRASGLDPRQARTKYQGLVPGRLATGADQDSR